MDDLEPRPGFEKPCQQMLHSIARPEFKQESSVDRISYKKETKVRFNSFENTSFFTTKNVSQGPRAIAVQKIRVHDYSPEGMRKIHYKFVQSYQSANILNPTLKVSAAKAGISTNYTDTTMRLGHQSPGEEVKLSQSWMSTGQGLEFNHELIPFQKTNHYPNRH